MLASLSDSFSRFCSRNRKVVVLITVGLFVHILVLKAAFDIYFSSPIDHGMTPLKSTRNPPADRVVFIVADGLRAEAIFGENQTDMAPNLKGIRHSRGSWGISHTRVPTESRPGHVALLGGIYEDPSAILKGWKVNPVDFDSVINQSANAWCWGGPSIINMFNRDDQPHIHLHSYDPKMEDFGNNNTIGLDLWVFEHVEQFLNDNIECRSCTKFKDKGNLFFLHLLGTDTAGHGFKPGSEGYKNNINFVDEYIPKLESWFEAAFPDKSTAYVFTADHGMTSWGSHGAGSDHETETPLIAWGAGIKVDDKQKDVQQIDIAPLLSALIGANYPINSQGQLPIEYIDTSYENLVEMVMSNISQLMEIFNIKRLRRMFNAIRFVPFQGVETEDLRESVKYLRNLSESGEHAQFKGEVQDFIEFLIKGSDYYHNYYQLPLLISITIGIIAWIMYLATLNVTFRRSLQPPRRGRFFTRLQLAVFIPVYINAFLLIKVQSLPIMYYFYFFFPIVMVQMIFRRYRYVLEALKHIKAFGFKKTTVHIFVYIFGLRLLVHGFHSRESLIIVMYVLASFAFWSTPLKTNSTKVLKVLWLVCCFSVAMFLFMPVMHTSFNTTVYLLGFGAWWILFSKFILPRLETDPSNKYVMLQHLIFTLTPIYTLAVEADILPSLSVVKVAALIWTLVPIILIPAVSTCIFTRTTSIFIAFGTYYLMVSANYEMLFITCFVSLMYAWVKLESKVFGYATIRKKTFNSVVQEDQEQTSDDFRRAFFFIALIFLGFFGTGNIASLNSFDPMWVRCFLTVFSPFKMAGLILLRIMVPFIFVTCVYRAVNLFRKGNTLQMFCIVLMFSDLMLLELLYDITNIGSWLEIGMSLSQFIIMEAFVVILLLLYGFAYFLTTMIY